MSDIKYPYQAPSVLRRFAALNWEVYGHDDEGHGQYRAEHNGLKAVLWHGGQGEWSWAVIRVEDDLLLASGRGHRSISSALVRSEWALSEA